MPNCIWMPAYKPQPSKLPEFLKYSGVWHSWVCTTRVPLVTPSLAQHFCVFRQISPLTLQAQKLSKEGSKCSFLGMVGGDGGQKKERNSIYQWLACFLPGNQDLQNSHFSNIRQKTVRSHTFLAV